MRGAQVAGRTSQVGRGNTLRMNVEEEALPCSWQRARLRRLDEKVGTLGADGGAFVGKLELEHTACRLPDTAGIGQTVGRRGLRRTATFRGAVDPRGRQELHEVDTSVTSPYHLHYAAGENRRRGAPGRRGRDWSWPLWACKVGMPGSWPLDQRELGRAMAGAIAMVGRGRAEGARRTGVGVGARCFVADGVRSWGAHLAAAAAPEGSAAVGSPPPRRRR